MADESVIIPLGITAKPIDKRGLRVVGYQSGACHHRNTTYIVDEKLAEVLCGGCGAKLDPLWCLRQLCEQESRWQTHYQDYKALFDEIKDRTRTKCHHCDQMTPISVKGRMRGLV